MKKQLETFSNCDNIIDKCLLAMTTNRKQQTMVSVHFEAMK